MWECRRLWGKVDIGMRGRGRWDLCLNDHDACEKLGKESVSSEFILQKGFWKGMRFG